MFCIYYYGRNQAKYWSNLLSFAVISVIGSFWSLYFFILSYLYNINNPKFLESSIFQVFTNICKNDPENKPTAFVKSLRLLKIRESWILNVWFEAYCIRHFISLFLLVMKFLFFIPVTVCCDLDTTSWFFLKTGKKNGCWLFLYFCHHLLFHCLNAVSISEGFFYPLLYFNSFYKVLTLSELIAIVLWSPSCSQRLLAHGTV